MAFSLRWPVLCVFLHTSGISSDSQASRSKSVGIICLGGYGRQGKQVLPPYRSMRAAAQIQAAPEQDASEENQNESWINGFQFLGRCRDGSGVDIKIVSPQHEGGTVEILTDSFCELLWGPLTYRPLLQKIVRENLSVSQKLFPKNVILVALLDPKGGERSSVWTDDSTPFSKVLVGTVEIHLKTGEFTPYLCNMAVKKEFRRLGIGWELLKAAEELAVKAGYKEMNLQCRLIDRVPLEIYKRAGYKVVSTTSFLSLLFLERRKHLMRKDLHRSEQ